MQKVVITAYGDEENLSIVDGELPQPLTGEVQLLVEYSVVSGSDVNMRRGTYPLQKKPPLTPGYSVVGTVHVNGAGCSRFALGTRVACLSKYDGQAEFINLPERFLVRVPDGVDPKFAVAVVLDWVTAYQMLHRVAHVRAGQQIFVHGLSGAVGNALLALGVLEGANVFGTASSGKHDALREAKAIPFDYSNKNWIAAIQERGGVDAVFDPLGYKSFDESYSILRKGGILVAYGMNLPGLSNAKRPSGLPVLLKLFARNLIFWSGKRTTFFGLRRNSRFYMSDLALLLEWVKAGKLSVPVKALFKLRDIKEAHRTYASGKGIGSIVIQVAETNSRIAPSTNLIGPDSKQL